MNLKDSQPGRGEDYGKAQRLLNLRSVALHGLKRIVKPEESQPNDNLITSADINLLLNQANYGSKLVRDLVRIIASLQQ